ncbi:MAG: hypothetical protein RLZZ417_1745 [Bacteroidota bacterium]|jgi:hypothetical protein
MNIKVNKKLARLLVLRIQLKEIISTKQVSNYYLLKEKRLSPRQPFLVSFIKIPHFPGSWEKE